MKKILFLLLITISGYSQTLQNPTFGTVTIKNSATVTSTPALTTTEAGGLQGKIDPMNLPFIKNQNSALQTGNFRISGTDSYFGTSKFYNSLTSSFPANFKIPAGSMNIATAVNDDINLITSGTGMTTIQGGWGLGFKPVAGLSAGPDFGANMGSIAYRPPTESMTKNFFIFRGGQYVFEDEGASWKMIITPTGVNIGGGATDVGGAIPMSLFEVNGNAVIGTNYDRTFAAPVNGLLVEGSVGIGTPTPTGKATIVTGSGLTFDPVNQVDKSISFSNGSAGVTVPYITGKSSNGIGLALAAVNIDANPNPDMLFRTQKDNNLDYTDLTKIAFRFQRFSNAPLLDILRNGNASFSGKATAGSPATVANDLMRKGEVDTAIATADAGNMKLTGNQTVSGSKSFTSQTSISGIAPNTAGLLNIQGGGAFPSMVVSSGGASINAFFQSTTSNNVVSNITTGGTGFNFVGQNDGTDTFTVNKTGQIKSNVLAGTGLRLLVADASGNITPATTLPVFADNTAAIAGGLGVGRAYRTVIGLLAIVF